MSEALASPTVEARGLVQHLEHPVLGEVKLIRPAHGLAAQEGRGAKAPPLLGDFSFAAPVGTNEGANTPPRPSPASIPTVNVSIPGKAAVTALI